MDTEDWVVSIIAMLVVIFVLSCVALISFYEPLIRNNAQNDCVERGFETFIDYTTFPFSTKPRALYCGTYEQRMINKGRITAYMTDKNGSIIISDLK